ncbi:MAG: HAD hydrolase family protein, partial [Aliifodinibius sp.]|nr:HAD hydrolase family protein [Fodinibius sp.]
QTGELLTGYQNHFQKEWSREEVERVMKRMEFVPHPQEYQSQFKVSYEVPHPVAYTEVLRELDIASIKAKTIFTGQKNLDLIPTSAGKGSALRYLHKQASINAKRVVVAGNSGEDLEMFEAPYKCIVVGNADQELNELEGEHIYHAPSAFADGVLEGLLYWKIL